MVKTVLVAESFNMVIEEVLRQFSPVNALEGQLLSQVAEKAQVVVAKKGTLMFKRGKVIAEYVFLIEGEVDLINNEFGAEKVLAGSERARSALNQESPTAVSAIAKSSVRYLKIDMKFLDQSLAEAQTEVAGPETENEVDWMTSMLQSPLFYRIPSSQLQELFKAFESVPVEKGERVIREGARGDYFYVLAGGTAVVSSVSGHVNLELRPGQYFGEEALISDAPRNASVTMTSRGLLKRLSATDFEVLLKNPVLSYLDASQLQSLTKPHKILDVRLPLEYRVEHVPGSVNVPLSRLRKSIKELSANSVYLVSDEAGPRADTAVYLLCQAGLDARILKDARSLTGLQSA